MSLREVDQFIKDNGHLLNMPTAEEVQESGVTLGDNQSKLLEKVEELTLYTIQQQDEIDELRALLTK